MSENPAPVKKIITNGKPRRGFVIAFTVTVLGFVALSLPEAVVGEDISLEGVFDYVKNLERRIIRVAGLAEYKIPSQVTLCGVEIPVNREEIKEALELEFYTNLSNRGKIILWVKRSGRYFPYIENELKKRGMPDDIKYLAVAESDLKPSAHSVAGAAGIWQFMEGTGNSHGLRVDRYIDQRRDFRLSTNAALNFLQRLYRQFNDWLLALAAYNAGPGRIADAVARQKKNSYFELDLPKETERYIYRIAAIKIILSSPQKYGVDLPPEEKYQLYDPDVVTMNFPSGVSLDEVAELSGTPLLRLKDLNPQIRTTSLPRGTHTIYLPKGAATAFVEAWNDKHKSSPQAEEQKKPEPKKIIHVVKQGETLASIARKYECSIDDIRKWNNMKKTDVLQAGRKLIIYR